MTSVAQMAGIIHSTSARKRVSALLKAYFDEAGTSGKTDGSFVVCGYVATEKDWDALAGKWQALLDKPCRYPVDTKNVRHVCRPLEYLHAAEMEGLGKGRFRRIGQRNRDYLVQ